MPGDSSYSTVFLVTGAETENPTLELDYVGASVAAASPAYSGSRAWRTRREDAIGGKPSAAISKWRGSWRLRHSGTIGWGDLASWWRSGSQIGRMELSTASGAWRIIGEGGIPVASGSAGDLASSGVFHHISLFVHHAAAGSVNLWANASLLAAVSASLGASPIDEVRLGGGAASGWSDYAYWDDIVLEDRTADGSPTFSGPRRLTLYPVRDDAAVEWVGSDGDSASNYLLVRTHDGDSTYVRASAASKTDRYLTQAASPAGSILGVVVLAAARREGAANRRLRVGVYRSGSISLSDPITLTGSYGRAKWWGFGRNPWTGCPWAASEVADLQTVIQSEI